MKNLFRKWRGLASAIALTATALGAATPPQVKTLGGGPNSYSPSRSGFVNGDTFSVAKFANPYAAALDAEGSLLIADRANNKIRRVTTPGVAGSLTSTFASGLPAPVGVVVDVSNRVFVVTYGDGRLRVFNSGGTLQRTVSGLVKPTALVLDRDGNVYVTEMSGAVKRIAPDNTVTTVATGFKNPQGIALLRGGLIAVSDTGNNAIYSVNPLDGTTVLLAGNNGAGFNDGPGDTAQFNKPFGLAAAPNGSIVIADRKNHRVRVLDTNNAVTTLYGVSKRQWSQQFPGWVDGDGGVNGEAAAHDPIGVTVAANGTVYTTEVYWDLLKQVTGTGLGSTNMGNTTNIVVVGTNTVVVVGTNVISLGFESGEASSDYIGAAGQSFYVPVTLAVAPGQSCYSFQMGLSATGETGVALNPAASGFVSMLMKPALLPGFFVPIDPNYTFLNSSINLLGVGWLEIEGGTDLYPADAQDLITTSIAKDTGLGKATGKVVLGAYRLPIPAGATSDATFRVALRNPSGSADGVSQPLPLVIPTDGSLQGGAVNTIKRVTLASRAYVVGDCVPFRWYNAGEFGEGHLANNDVINLFETAVYGFNFKSDLFDSDLFNAMDSSDGSSGTVSFGDDITINAITMGDGDLAVDDVWVTFRRSLDPTLKWYARFWTNGARAVVEIPNPLLSGFGDAPKAVAASVSRSKAVTRPVARVAVDDASTTAGTELTLPVRLSLSDEYALRVMMVNVTVEALDGSPALTSAIQFQTSPAFRAPEISSTRGLNNYSAAWLDSTVVGLQGDSVLALVNVRVPANAGANAAYRVHFDHFSGSPNGVALFDSRTTSGLILLSDRSASTWGDGIADAWRLRYFGSIYAAGSEAGADADADAVTNAVEYQNGTDPTDATSY